MNKINIGLITSMLLAPIYGLSQEVILKSDYIYAYEKPKQDSKRVKLEQYKKYDIYEIISCNKYGWCKSKDGYVKEIILEFKKEEKKEYNKRLVKEEKIPQKQIIQLSLKKLIIEAIKRNGNISFEELQSKIYNEQIKYEKDITTPEFFINAKHQRVNNPNNTESTLSRGNLSVYKENRNNIDAGLSGVLSYGTQWSATLKNNNHQSTLIDKYKDYKTEYETSLELTVKQPLLKGFGEDITMSKYNMAKKDKDIHKENFKKKIMDIMNLSIQSYWKLYGIKQLEKSWENSLKISQDMLELLENKYKSGDVGYSEVLEAKSGVLNRKADYVRMKNRYIEIKNELLTLLNAPVDLNKNIEFELEDKPKIGNEDNYLEIDEYYNLALNNWPEFNALKEKLRKENIQIELAKNQDKPKLDLVGSVWNSTLDKEQNAQILDDEFISWYLGFEFSIPLSFEPRSKNAINIAKLRKKQLEIEFDSLNKSLYNNLDTKLKHLKNMKRQVLFYKEGLEIKEELYKYEKERFNLGETSIRNVLIQEEDILEYQRKLFNTIIEWKLAGAVLDKAVGLLFKKYHNYDFNNIKEIKEIKSVLSNNSFGNL